MKDDQNKSKSESSLSQDLESIVKKIEDHKPAQATVKSLKDIKTNILNKERLWLTMDGENWVFVELRGSDLLWINYGLDEQETTLKIGIKNIYDFLTFKKSIDMLGQ